MESLENQQQCNNPSNPDDAMMKLESMCKKQNKINKQSQKQCNNPSNTPGAGKKQREALGRLAGEQAALRRSLEDLNREFGQSRQILGRLDNIADEMKKVEDDLASGDVGEETTQRQLKIFSRLLEASRSLQRKDVSEQRQARSATDNIFHLPPELSVDLLNDDSGLESRLQQYLGDEYPPQYEQQIKAYFRALLQIQHQLQQPAR